jgi:hypothetical protein
MTLAGTEPQMLPSVARKSPVFDMLGHILDSLIT